MAAQENLHPGQFDSGDEITNRIAKIRVDVDKGVNKYNPAGEPYTEGSRVMGGHLVKMRRNEQGQETWQAQGVDGVYHHFNNQADLEKHVRGEG